MSLLRNLAGLVVGIVVLLSMSAASAAGRGRSERPAGSFEFTGASFSCLQYTNGLGDNSVGKMQSSLAHLWVEGYLAGYYRGQGNLEFSDDAADLEAIDTRLTTLCAAVPQTSILAVALQGVATTPHKLPVTAISEFSPSTYTCGQHLDAKNGAAAAANRADLVEMWAFAFIQGFKNVKQPEMLIDLQNKPTLINLILSDRYCGGSRDKLLMDTTALLAERVKMAQ